MALAFTATESGFDNGMGGASNAIDQHYVLFGKDETGVYFEYDDQKNGSVDCIARIGVRRGLVIFFLVDSETITVKRNMDDSSWTAFLNELHRVFGPIVVPQA